MAVDMNKYMENLKNYGASIKPPAVPADTPNAIAGGAGAARAAFKAISGTVGTPGALASGTANTSVSPITASTKSYGSNIGGFDSSNDVQKQIADYGQQWANAGTKADKDRIAAESLKVGTAAGGTRDASGKWSFAQPVSMTGAPPLEKPNDYAWIEESVMSELATQKQAIEQELARLNQASTLAVDQNNTFLQEQIKGLNEQKAVTDNNIATFQNRRGGFYSGGTDFQLGNNARGFAQAEGGIRKDVAARNADIWGRNSLLAQQAAEKISLLTQQAPGKIRELIMGQQDKDRNFAVQEAGVTGMYNGAQTPDGVAQSLTNEINRLKLANLPEELKLGLKALEDDVALGALNLQEAQIKLKELQDPNSITNKSKALALEADKLGLKELRKRIEQIGQVPAMTYEEQRTKEINLEKAEIELNNLKNGGGQTAADKRTYYDSMIQRNDTTGAITNLTSLEQAIMEDASISDYDAYQLTLRYGIPWKGEVPKPGN